MTKPTAEFMRGFKAACDAVLRCYLESKTMSWESIEPDLEAMLVAASRGPEREVRHDGFPHDD